MKNSLETLAQSLPVLTPEQIQNIKGGDGPQPGWVLVGEWVIGNIRYRKYFTGMEYIIVEDQIM